MTTNIKVQNRHQWNSDTVFQEVLRAVYQTSEEFWVYSCNTDQECITFGWDGISPDTRSPVDIINNIPVYNIFRNGGYSYLGPGILGLIMLISPRVVLDSTGIRPSEIKSAIMQAVIDYVADNHDLQLFYNDADPGLYDDTGAKVASIDFTYMNSSVFVFYCSLNFRADLAKFQGLNICGIENRAMANIFKTGTSITDQELEVLGAAVVEKIINKLYGADVNTV